MTTKTPRAVCITEMANREFANAAQSPAPECFEENTGTDTVIIGGGYTGLSAALRLAKAARAAGKPVNVTVLEADRVGSGASGKSGGHVNGGFQEKDEQKVLKYFSTPEEGRHILSVINEGPALVEDIISEYGIDCDLRKGYVMLHNDGSRTFDPNGGMGIEPYPYVLGIAKAARNLGVKIYEKTPVNDIIDHGQTYDVQTSRGTITADNMLCCGGHRMGETIPFLSSLRSKTIEVLVTTICTDSLPAAVIDALMPEADGRRYPFCDDNHDVSFGIIDRYGRIIFGSKVGVFKVTASEVAQRLFELFPDLQDIYRRETGRELGYRAFVSSETLNFTANMLPNVGKLGTEKNVRYVHGLGGHGIALGTMLGKIAAADIAGENTADFSILSGIRHMGLPTWKPLRLATAWAGVTAVKTWERFEKALNTLEFNR